MALNKKCICLLLIIGLLLVVSSSMGDSSIVDYKVPEIVKAKELSDFYGVWKCKYIVVNGVVSTFGDYVDIIKASSEPLVFHDKSIRVDQLSNDCYEIFDEKYNVVIWGSLCVVDEMNVQFEDGHIIDKSVPNVVSTVELLADGNLSESGSADGVSVSMIYTKESVPFIGFFTNSVSEVSVSTNDLSALSYDDLVKLVSSAQLEMMTSDKWQEVVVPEGVYKIGEDIPAGHWTITAPAKVYCVQVCVGPKLFDNGRVNYDNFYALHGKDNSLNYEGETNYISVVLKNGQYISIEDGSAIFTPFAGNSFSFK